MSNSQYTPLPGQQWYTPGTVFVCRADDGTPERSFLLLSSIQVDAPGPIIHMGQTFGHGTRQGSFPSYYIDTVRDTTAWDQDYEPLDFLADAARQSVFSAPASVADGLPAIGSVWLEVWPTYNSPKYHPTRARMVIHNSVIDGEQWVHYISFAPGHYLYRTLLGTQKLKNFLKSTDTADCNRWDLTAGVVALPQNDLAQLDFDARMSSNKRAAVLASAERDITHSDFAQDFFTDRTPVELGSTVYDLDRNVGHVTWLSVDSARVRVTWLRSVGPDAEVTLWQYPHLPGVLVSEDRSPSVVAFKYR
jgi:hypothetical protein